MRVVSLLPSATEMLFAIGAGDLLVGRSHECDFPPPATATPVLTAQRTPAFSGAGASAAIDAAVRSALAAGEGLYTLDAERLAALAPDVILTQDLCGVCSIDGASVERALGGLRHRPTVLAFNPASHWQVLDDMLVLGDAVERGPQALAAVTALRDRWWSAAELVTPYTTGPSVLMLEWTDPAFVGGHWTPELIEAAGGRHLLNPAGAPSRVATPEEIVASAPERVIVAPCGLDLARTREAVRELATQAWWRALPAVRSGAANAVMLVDGNQMFNRPGPRLVDAFEWLVAWLADRPEHAPPGFPAEPAPHAALAAG